MAAFSANRPIYQQIEQEADLYEPAVYQLLSFYHALEAENEPLDGQFIPLTTVIPRAARDCKIFAIGLIPPSAIVTGEVLDRSASLEVLGGSLQEVVDANKDVGSSSTGDLPGETGGVSTSTPSPVGPTASDSDDFFTQYVVMCNRLGCQPEELARLIQTECDWREHAVGKDQNGKPIAKGLIQLVRETALGLGMTEEQYANFENLSRTEQLPWIEKFYKGRAKGRSAAELKSVVFGGFNNPDGSIYNGTATAPGFRQPERQRDAYLKNINLDGPPRKGYLTPEDLYRVVAKKQTDPKVLAGIQKAKASLGMGAEPSAVPQDARASKEWEERGKANANKFAKTAAQVANKDLNQTNLGQQFLAAQRSTIMLMRAALEQMAKTPPLRLLVNPQSFRVSSEKVISSGNWGRNGPIIEQWGDNQDKIEGSGKIAAYFSMDARNANGPGLTRTARQFSTSYQNLLSLFLLYRNNGGVWFPDPLVPGSARVKNLSLVGSVYLYYDDILYVGSFDSLSLSESDGMPFSLEYTFSFTVRAWYLLDHLDDPQYTYGRGAAPSLPTGTGGSPLSGGNNPQPSPEVPLPAPNVTSNSDPLHGLLTRQTIGDELEGIDD